MVLELSPKFTEQNYAIKIATAALSEQLKRTGDDQLLRLIQGDPRYNVCIADQLKDGEKPEYVVRESFDHRVQRLREAARDIMGDRNKFPFEFMNNML